MDDREIARLKKERRQAEKRNNLNEVAQYSNYIGKLLARQGKYEEAILEHQHELQLCEALEDKIGHAISHRNISECLTELGKYEEAAKSQNIYIQLAKDCKNDLELQRAYATRGNTLLKEWEDLGSGDKDVLKSAERAFLKSLEICARLKATVKENEYAEMKARLLLNLGLVFDSKGNIQECSEFLKQAIALTQKHNLLEDSFRCQYSLAGMYQKAGNFSQALRYMNLALQCAEKQKSKRGQYEAHRQRALYFLQLGDYAAAKRCLKKVFKLGTNSWIETDHMQDTLNKTIKLENFSRALDEKSENDLKERMPLYEKLGDILSGLGFFQTAVQHYQNMLKCAEELHLSQQAFIPILNSLAQTYSDLREYNKAIEYFTKELQYHSGDKKEECQSWLNIASAQFDSGQTFDEINKSYGSALDLAKEANLIKLQCIALNALAEVQNKFHLNDEECNTKRDLDDLMSRHNLTDDDLEGREESQDLPSEDSDIDVKDLSDSDESENEEFDRTKENDANTIGRSRRNRMKSVKRNEKGETELHRACIEGNIKKVKNLIEKNHPVNPRDYCGWLPLHEAANHDNLEVVEYLLEHGADINDRGGRLCDGITPLHDSAGCGNLEVIELLVKRGANVHAKCDQGNTALDCLMNYRKNSEETLSKDELLQIKSIENLLRKVIKGGNPNLPERIEILNRDSDVIDEEDLPDLVRRSRRKEKKSLNLRRGEDESDSSDTEKENRESLSCSNRPPTSPSHSNSDSEFLTQAYTAPKAGRAEYEKIMSSLGSAATRKPSTQQSMTSAKKPALLSEGETVDEWLIDDMPTIGKRKRSSAPQSALQIPSERKRTKYRNDKARTYCETDNTILQRGDLYEENSNSSDGINFLPTVNDLGNYDLEGNDNNWASIDSDSSTNSNVQGDERHPIDRSQRLKLKSRQLTMTQFSKPNQFPGSLPDLTPSTQLASTFTNSNPVVTNLVSSTPGSSNSVMRLKVRIKDKLILVPCVQGNETHTIGWLATQSAERYYNLHNLRPILSLATKDGALLSPDDLVSVLLSNNEEIIATVDSWDLPPPEVRYNDACKTIGTIPYKNVKTMLQTAAATNELDLGDLALKNKALQPIFRALQCQYGLRMLHLQGNRLGDQGVQSLVKILTTLPNLTDLNLACNGISQMGLSSIAEELSTNNTLQMLESLNLSYNSLGDTCTLSISKMISLLPMLQKIQLKSCELTLKFFQQHRMTLSKAMQDSNLQALDVSNNDLGSTGVELLLNSINVKCVTDLNLSGVIKTYTANHISKSIEQYLLKNECVLQNLCLDNCYLLEENIEDLHRALEQNHSLVSLSISGHPKLTGDDMTMLLNTASEHPNCKLEYVTMFRCGIVSPLSTPFIDAVNDKLCCDVPLKQIKFSCDQLQKSDVDCLVDIWKQKWGENIKVCQSGNHLEITVMV